MMTQRTLPTRGLRKYSVNHNFFQHIVTEEQAYWLGFIAADGNIYRHQLRLELKAEDIEHLRKFLIALQATYPISIHRTCRVVAINSKYLVSDLFKLGVTPQKSKTLTPIINFPSNLQNAYWRGIFDGDGCLFYTHKHYPGLTLVGSKNTVNEFAIFCKQLSETKASVCSLHNSFQFRVVGSNLASPILKQLYGNARIFLNRKMNLAQKILTEAVC